MRDEAKAAPGRGKCAEKLIKTHLDPCPKRKTMPDMKTSLLLLLASCLAASSALAKRVTVEFEAEAATVTGNPFGMTVPRLTVVRGYFTYESSTPDTFSNPADTMRGSFVIAGTWDFRAAFLGHEIRGSGTATSSTNLFGSPTLRFEDGKGNSRPELMSIDGLPDANIGLTFAISGEAKDLPTDQLPENFTFNPPPGGASHTFSLHSNSGAPETTGTMLLQFRSFRQVELLVQPAIPTGDQVEVSWLSVAGKRYGLAHSTNLVDWVVIQNEVLGGTNTTMVVDDLDLRYPTDPIPTHGYYRVLDLGPLIPSL